MLHRLISLIVQRLRLATTDFVVTRISGRQVQVVKNLEYRFPLKLTFRRRNNKSSLHDLPDHPIFRSTFMIDRYMCHVEVPYSRQITVRGNDINVVTTAVASYY